MDSLDEFLLAGEQASDGFHVTDDGKANWTLRKLAAIRARRSDNCTLAEKEVARVQEWLERVNGSLDSQEERFTSLLHEYAYRERADSDRKTIDLSCGVIKTTESHGRPVITDQQEVTGWAAHDHPDWVVESTVHKTPAASIAEAFKSGQIKYVDGVLRDTDTGQEIPGIAWKPPSLKTTVVTAEPTTKETP